MRDHHHFLFYSTSITSSTLILDADETRHAIAVLRLQQNDRLRVTDGSGTIFDCRHSDLVDRELHCSIENREHHHRHHGRLHLLVGVPERDPFEELLVDLAALGMERITPLVCTTCQKPWWEKRWDERLTGKMITGMKQSLYPWLPILDAPVHFPDVKTLIENPLLVADADGEPLAAALGHCRDKRVTAIVGPPGGLTDEEMRFLRKTCGNGGAIPVRLAPTRLTTRLAATALAAAVTMQITPCHAYRP